MPPSSLREELKKKGPFESLEQEAMLGTVWLVCCEPSV